MLRMTFRTSVEAFSAHNSILVIALIGGNMLFNIIANTSFKYSALSPSWRGLFGWQVVGNLAGLITVITLTWLLRSVPLNVAFPITTGLAVIGVQVFAARMLFHESISPTQWLGTLFVVVGIALISGR